MKAPPTRTGPYRPQTARAAVSAPSPRVALSGCHMVAGRAFRLSPRSQPTLAQGLLGRLGCECRRHRLPQGLQRQSFREWTAGQTAWLGGDCRRFAQKGIFIILGDEPCHLQLAPAWQPTCRQRAPPGATTRHVYFPSPRPSNLIRTIHATSGSELEGFQTQISKAFNDNKKRSARAQWQKYVLWSKMRTCAILGW